MSAQTALNPRFFKPTVLQKTARQSLHLFHTITTVTPGGACDGGDDGDGHRLSLWSGHAFTPGKRGPSRRYSITGGASAAFRHRQGANRGLQGLRFAPGSVGQRASALSCAGWRERRWCEPRCVPGLQVCTPAKRKTARIENSMLARVCSRFARWVAEIGPRAFAHRLTHRTQVVVTSREARTRARV